MEETLDYVEHMYKETISEHRIDANTLVIVMWFYVLCKVIISLYYDFRGYKR